MQIVKVEDAHRNGRLRGDRLLLPQDLLALVLVGQSCGFVEIDFVLQFAIERGSSHRANKFEPQRPPPIPSMSMITKPSR